MLLGLLSGTYPTGYDYSNGIKKLVDVDGLKPPTAAIKVAVLFLWATHPYDKKNYTQIRTNVNV